MKKFLFALGTAIATLQAKEPSRQFQQRVISAVIWSEARGEGYAAMQAVAEVIRNRSHRSRDSVFKVVMAPKQFSCLNGISAFRLAERMELAEGDDRLHATYADTLAFLLLSENIVGNVTAGATHFHDDSVDPEWAWPADITVKVGRLIFYKIEE